MFMLFMLEILRIIAEKSVLLFLVIMDLKNFSCLTSEVLWTSMDFRRLFELIYFGYYILQTRSTGILASMEKLQIL